MFPLMIIVQEYKDRPPPAIVDKKLDTRARWTLATISGDALLTITLMAVGLLALFEVLPGMPPAASYTLMSVSTLFLASWIVMAALTHGRSLTLAKSLVQSAVSSNPKIKLGWETE